MNAMKSRHLGLESFIPQLSIIVATYNQADYLARCLRSVFNQTVSSQYYEVIVVDDASLDETPVILNAFGPRIKRVRHELNYGLPQALNSGIRVSTAPYFVRVDSDDFVNEHFVSIFLAYVELREKVHAVSCDYLIVDESEDIVSYGNSEKSPIGCGVLFNKAEAIETGLYDPEFLRHEEREFRLRFEQKYPVERIPIPLYRYRRHESNITNDLELMSYFDGLLKERRIPFQSTADPERDPHG